MSRQHLILLGYEVGSGEPVSIPLGHMAVTGQTQAAGKTTTLEACAHRAGCAVLAFVTKRGEGSFGTAPGHDVHNAQPYFRERADWQFVEAVLEATMRERMKYERQWIMKVSRGAATLGDVRHNTAVALDAARGEFMKGTYEKLLAYLDIVVPQIANIRWAPFVHLYDGLNVMNLSGMASELQALVISSCLEFVLAEMRDVIVIIPEAWEFIPRGRKSPVTLAAEAYVRKGAALRDYLWIDSQDLAGVHTPILKSTHVFLLGVQREINEIKRTIAHLHGPAKPKPDVIAQLGIGQFVACHGSMAVTTYVQPWWMVGSEAQAVARGRDSTAQHQRPRPVLPQVQRVADPRQDPPGTWTGFKTAEEHEAMADKLLQQENQRLQDENARLKQQLERIERELQLIKDKVPASELRSWDAAPSANVPLSAIAGPGEIDALYATLRDRFLNDVPVLRRLQLLAPEIEVTVERNVITMDGDSLQGRIAKLIARGFLDEPTRAVALNKELNRTGGEVHSGNLNKALVKMRLDGFVTREGDEWQKSPALKVTTRELQAVV